MPMPILIDLPAGIESHLRATLGDLDVAAKEALLVELYRQRKLTARQLSEALGISRFGTEALLKRHEVCHDVTRDDVIVESEGLRELRAKHGDRR